MSSRFLQEQAQHVTGVDHNMEKSWTPLILSLMAGLSTSLGAAVVFCAAPSSTSKSDGSRNQKGSVISHARMAFALSMAGSVMVTVSLVSILPESFSDEETGTQFLAIGSRLFMERCISFAVGGALYLALSKCAFPEPDSILGLETHDVLEEAAATETRPLRDECTSRDGNQHIVDNDSSSTPLPSDSDKTMKTPPRSSGRRPLHLRIRSQLSADEEDHLPLVPEEDTGSSSLTLCQSTCPVWHLGHCLGRMTRTTHEGMNSMYYITFGTRWNCRIEHRTGHGKSS